MNNNYPKQKKPIYVCAINYTKENNNIESIEKQIKLAKEFEPEFKELYNNLTQRFTFEFEKKDFNEKIEFLEFLINEITESLIKAKNKFSLISESSINKVESLRDTFERELNKVYINNAETNKSSKKKPIPKFEEVINKKLKWNKKQIETLENELKRNFADIISKSYYKEGRGSKEPLTLTILHLGKKEIIDFEAIEAKKFLRFFVNLFLGENYNWENFEDRDYILFAEKLRKFKNNKNDINTKKYKEQIKPVFEKIEEKHIFIKIADISIN